MQTCCSSTKRNDDKKVKPHFESEKNGRETPVRFDLQTVIVLSVIVSVAGKRILCSIGRLNRISGVCFIPLGADMIAEFISFRLILSAVDAVCLTRRGGILRSVYRVDCFLATCYSRIPGRTHMVPEFITLRIVLTAIDAVGLTRCRGILRSISGIQRIVPITG